MNDKVNSEDTPGYIANRTPAEEKSIRSALNILEKRMRTHGTSMTSPADVKDYLTLRLAEYEHEVFIALFLDSQHRVIECEEMFRGTINGASVHPREVVKAVLQHNAAAVIFAHNHPSGVPEPSKSDEHITRRLVQALELIEVRVLDHIIVGGMDTVAFSERGLI